jgi:uncharacterized protein (UPF0332 family)
MERHNEIGTKWDLAQYRLQIAREDMEYARKLYEENRYRIANNRAYYAIFHAISAIHALDGKSYHKHKDAIANFNREYINKDVFPREYGRKIVKAEKIRTSSDYDDFYIASKSVTHDLIVTAHELLDLIEEYIKMHR